MKGSASGWGVERVGGSLWRWNAFDGPKSSQGYSTGRELAEERAQRMLEYFEDHRLAPYYMDVGYEVETGF